MIKRSKAWIGGVSERAVTFRKALGLVIRTAPRESVLMGGLLVVQGLLSPISVWLVKAAVDDVVGRAPPGHLLLLVVGWAIAALFAQLANQWTTLIQANLNERVTARVELLLMRKANRLPDLATFEEPAFYDDLQILRNQAPFRPMNLMVTTSTLLSSVVASVGLLALVGSLAWWLPVLIVVATFPLSFALVRLQQQSWTIFQKQNPLIRAMRYFVTVATTAPFAKEVRLYGSGPFFEQRYADAFETMRRESTRERFAQAGRPVVAALLFVAVTALAFGWTALNALNGRFGVGDVVLLLQGIVTLDEKLGSIAGMISVLAGHLVFFEKLFGFLSRESAMPVARPGRPIPRPLARGVAFEAVSYRYPNGKLALDGVSFRIEPGERVALVGENGAGKSTLVKLLCRLYDPSAGRITVDGVDLRELDLEGWRASLGTVFQDFGRYQITVADNIGLGRMSGEGHRVDLETALRRSGFVEHLSALPHGLTTKLGVEFGGADLSGGQWQSLAIARAFLLDAEVLILDEPTAALDPRAEATLFQRFAELSAGKTTILVTHRLASVRMADRILVLKDGRLIEEGPHEVLLSQNGEYASLYQMQAEQYERTIA